MLRKIISLSLICLLVITMTGCSSDEKEKINESENEISTPREFTESNGIIKYFTINGEKIALPETVGEYVNYLEKLGKVELGDTKKSINEADKMEANEIASLTTVLNVFAEGSSYHEFGINYFNPEDKKIDVADAKVSRITLIYDIYSDLKEDQLIDTIVLVTTGGEIPIDGKMTSSKIMKMLGAPDQNTDGYLKYTDEAGFTYKFATENKKGILTKVQIDFPKK